MPTTCAVGLALALLLSSGCTTPDKTLSLDGARSYVTYQPTSAPAQIDASASVEVTHTLDPVAAADWKKTPNSDQRIALHRQAVVQILTDDFEKSGLFARILPPNSPVPPDYVVKIRSTLAEPSNNRLSLTLTLSKGPTGAEVGRHTREAQTGNAYLEMGPTYQRLMTALKADVVYDLQGRKLEQEQIANIAALPMADLLSGRESRVFLARARNHALIAAKIQQLPVMLREEKTDGLTALVIKIEQTILDLDHECETTKDRAQQAIADGSPGGARADRSSVAEPENDPLEELRGLAICYRERIELLKPMLAALKEEIANRNR